MYNFNDSVVWYSFPILVLFWLTFEFPKIYFAPLPGLVSLKLLQSHEFNLWEVVQSCESLLGVGKLWSSPRTHPCTNNVKKWQKMWPKLWRKQERVGLKLATSNRTLQYLNCCWFNSPKNNLNRLKATVYELWHCHHHSKEWHLIGPLIDTMWRKPNPCLEDGRTTWDDRISSWRFL